MGVTSHSHSLVSVLNASFIYIKSHASQKPSNDQSQETPIPINSSPFRKENGPSSNDVPGVNYRCKG